MPTLDEFYQNLWQAYSDLNPAVLDIRQAFIDLGETVINDHVAFRTFSHPWINMAVMSELFEQLGYQEKGQYRFEQKHLNAKHFEKYGYPKIFISELQLEECSESLQSTVIQAVESLGASQYQRPDLLWSGRLWPAISQADYHQLKQESEYAAWTLVFGFLPNHFTVSVDHLQQLSSLEAVNAFIKHQGYQLNTSGGEIKGQVSDCLRQSSTMAHQRCIAFADGQLSIPTVFYEFAQRYTLPNGDRFEGFLAANADKIFDSTTRKTLE